MTTISWILSHHLTTQDSFLSRKILTLSPDNPVQEVQIPEHTGKKPHSLNSPFAPVARNTLLGI